MLSETYCKTRDPHILEAFLPVVLHDAAEEVKMAGAQMTSCDERIRGAMEGLLEDQSPKVRRTVAGRLGEASVEPLIKALHDDDAGVRAAAAQSLGKVKDPRAAAPLMELVRTWKDLKPKEPNEDNASPSMMPLKAVWAAVDALGFIGDPSPAGLLLDILRDEHADLELKYCAVKALGRLKDERIPDVLIRTLKSTDVFLRRNAAAALGYTKEPWACGPLIEALKDEDQYVRAISASSLGMIGDHSAIGPLIEALEDKDARVRSKAVLSLGYLMDPLAVEPLIRLLGAAQRQVQPDAGWGLNMITMAGIGDDPQKWREWWQENKEVCTKFNEMERELMTKASAELLERIKASLQDRNPYVRERSLYALRHFPANDVLDLLHSGLEDKDPEVRKFGGLALEQIEAKGRIRK